METYSRTYDLPPDPTRAAAEPRVTALIVSETYARPGLCTNRTEDDRVTCSSVIVALLSWAVTARLQVPASCASNIDSAAMRDLAA